MYRLNFHKLYSMASCFTEQHCQKIEMMDLQKKKKKKKKRGGFNRILDRIMNYNFYYIKLLKMRKQ